MEIKDKVPSKSIKVPPDKVPPDKLAKVISGCLLVVVLFFLVPIVWASVVVLMDPIKLPSGPTTGATAVTTMVAFGLIILLGRIAAGLIGTLLGRQMSLIPASWQVILALFLGLGGLGIGVAMLMGLLPGNSAGMALGMAPVFLSISFRTARHLLRRRRDGD